MDGFVYSVLLLGVIFPRCHAQLLPDNLFRFLGPDYEFRPKIEKANSFAIPTPPPHERKALTARYVLHVSDWGSVATISTQHGIAGLPYANVFSISDGIVGNFSGGVPYFYMTPMDVSAKDIADNPSVTLVVSEAQSDLCRKSGLDPESPVCARVMLTGHIEKLRDGDEIVRARHLLFARHPAMASWPKAHRWFFSKLNIKRIQLLDFYGGITNVPLKDYFDAELYPV